MSTDFGATWTAKATPSPPLFSGILSLAVDPDRPGTLVAVTRGGLYQSTDGASSWSSQPGTGSPQTGLPFSPAGDLSFVLLSHKCNPGGGLFAAGRTFANFNLTSTYQIAFSPDDGASWKTPQLTRITGVAGGADCSVYITRQVASDTFVAKLAPNGTTLWATLLGGSDEDAPVALALDAQGNAYVTGNTTSPDFPSSVPRIGVPGQRSVFLTKFLPDGSVGYSVTLGGDSINTVTAIAADLSGNIYVTGSTNSTNFPVTPGTFMTSLSSGSYTGFLVKLSSSAGIVYATYLGARNTIQGDPGGRR